MANNCSRSNPITATIELMQDLMVMYSLNKFGAHWFIIVDARVFTKTANCSNFSNSMANYSSRSNPIRPIIKLIHDLMVIYILAKFSADWLKIVDAREQKSQI